MRICIVGLATAVSGSEFEDHALLLERLVEDARSFDLPDNVEIRMDQKFPPPALGESELADLRRLALVDATARNRLGQVEEEIKAGGVERSTLLMYVDSDHWRINTDRRPFTVVKFSDSATNGRTKWHLSDRKLQYANHNETIEKFAIESGPWLVRLWLGNMVTGAGWPLESDPELLHVAENPDGFLYTIQSGDTIRRLTLVFDPEMDKPRVTLVERRLSNKNNVFYPVARFSDWEWNESLGRSVAHRYEMITESGTPELTIRIIMIKSLERDMDRLTALPTSDGVDLFRGDATFIHVTNLSRGEMSSVDTADRTVLETIAIRRRTDGSLRVLGLVAMGAVALTVALFVRSKVNS
jgi:hypothetical protein